MADRLKFSLEDLRQRLRRHERMFAEDGDLLSLVAVARTRRWLDLDGSQALFADAATQLERNMRENDTASADGWAWAGGLWHLAGNPANARRLLKKAMRSGIQKPPFLFAAPGTLYLLHKLDRAARIAPDGRLDLLALGAKHRDPELVEQAREGIIKEHRLYTGGPHYSVTGTPLTDWDWIEETFRLEAELHDQPTPDHTEMLRRLGVLREADEPPEIEPPRPAPRPGFRAELEPRDGQPATLEVVDDDFVVVTLKPQTILQLIRDEAGWGVRLSTARRANGSCRQAIRRFKAPHSGPPTGWSIMETQPPPEIRGA